jgi:hypothetical protein
MLRCCLLLLVWRQQPCFAVRLARRGGHYALSFDFYSVRKTTMLLRADVYSVRRAIIGSIFAARRAGMKPAMTAEADSTTTAIARLKGS